jgi:uncharacterized protein
MASLIFSADRSLEHEPLPAEQVHAGRPTTAVWEAPVPAVSCGMWEHSVGVSSDVEVHEVFVVLSGRARIEVAGQDDLHVGPGDVVELEAGAQTVWHVSEPLRKFWVAAG